MSITGAGYLTALDVLCDCSYQLYEPIANTIITGYQAAGYGDGGFSDGGYSDGNGVVLSVQSTLDLFGRPVFYAGALVVVGFGLPTAEVATVLQVETGQVIVTALANNHNNGEKLFSPTFPVQQPTDPLWTQGEMLAYLSSACNDFLTEVPLVYGTAGLSMPPTQQNAPLPLDCMEPMRIAYQDANGLYPLRETSQANLDTYDYRWQQQATGKPKAYFRDKIPTQMFGIWPRMANTAIFETVYSRRQVDSMQLLDGFLFPDVFVPVVKYRVFSFAYSKDGEARNPGLAKYFAARYDFGVKVASMFLDAIQDPNLELAG